MASETQLSEQTVVQCTKVGRYNFVIYRADARNYSLYVKQSADLRQLLGWRSGYTHKKSTIIKRMTTFVCQQCPGARPPKVQMIIGDEIKYTCYSFPVESGLRIRNNQVAAREFQKLVPLDMKDKVGKMVAHLYSKDIIKVVEINYDTPQAPHYLLQWPNGFLGKFDFDFSDTMFRQVKAATAHASEQTTIVLGEKISIPKNKRNPSKKKAKIQKKKKKKKKRSPR